MTDSNYGFENGKCPHCGGSNIQKEHNLLNIGFMHGAGYFLDFPFGPTYTCRDCDSVSDECFVATAVYGDANAREVNILRQFRDDVLMDSAMGRAFVRFYYSGAGKKAARLIKTKVPSAIQPIRAGLDRLVETYSRKIEEK